MALFRQVAPPWVLPGVVLYGARTFLDPKIGIAIARSTWIPGLLYHETFERFPGFILRCRWEILLGFVAKLSARKKATSVAEMHTGFSLFT